MTNIRLQTNSLRLNHVIGRGGLPHDLHPEWFYNGSLKFKEADDNPRVFESLSEAIQYFTEKLPRCKRAIGQYVTWAQATDRNWVLFVYIGPNVSDEEYSNPDNWLPFGQVTKDEYTDISESIDADVEFIENLVALKDLTEEIESELNVL